MISPDRDNDGEHKSKAVYYDDLAYSAIRELIRQEHAVVWHEVEAKLAEHDQPGAPRGINPHHLTNGRRRLVADNIIEELTDRTYGNRPVTVLVPCDRRGRRDAIRTAMRRKRALEARYLSWAQASERHPNLIGNGGERVVLESLRKTVAGYGLINPRHGEVDSLFGEKVPGGSLDNAAHIALEAGDQHLAVTVLIEVKNLRGWIYPATNDLFQLLYTDQAMPGVTNWFDQTLPREGAAKAMRWAEMAPNLNPHFGILRRDSLSGQDREAEMDRLYRDATTMVALGPRGAWRRLSEPPTEPGAPIPF